jgi:hypothetical protein
MSLHSTLALGRHAPRTRASSSRRRGIPWIQRPPSRCRPRRGSTQGHAATAASFAPHSRRRRLRHPSQAAAQPPRPHRRTAVQATPRRPTTQLPLPSRPGQTAAAAGPNSPAGVMSSSSSFSSLGESTRTIFFSKSFDESWDKIKKRLFHF